MGEGAFGIDVPDGDPGALEAAAADLRGVSGAMQSASEEAEKTFARLADGW